MEKRIEKIEGRQDQKRKGKEAKNKFDDLLILIKKN
jgi:hypothetical protein